MPWSITWPVASRIVAVSQSFAPPNLLSPDGFSGLYILQNSEVRAVPQTALGEFMTLPRPSSQPWRGYLLPISHPIDAFNILAPPLAPQQPHAQAPLGISRSTSDAPQFHNLPLIPSQNSGRRSVNYVVSMHRYWPCSFPSTAMPIVILYGFNYGRMNGLMHR